MTVLRERGEYVVRCDSDPCDETIEGNETFQDAIDALRDAGWRTRRNVTGEYEHVCPNCS